MVWAVICEIFGIIGVRVMEDPKKRYISKPLAVALAIAVIVFAAAFLYLGAFVTEKPPRIEAAQEPHHIQDNSNDQDTTDPEFKELSQVEVIKNEQSPQVNGAQTQVSQPPTSTPNDDKQHGKKRGIMNRLRDIL